LKLNATHQLLVYADNVKILHGRIYNVKKNTEALTLASKESDLEIETSRTACRMRSQHKYKE